MQCSLDSLGMGGATCCTNPRLAISEEGTPCAHRPRPAGVGAACSADSGAGTESGMQRSGVHGPDPANGPTL